MELENIILSLPGSEGQNLACFLSGGKYTPNTNVEIF
jgi:hypothetical protein